MMTLRRNTAAGNFRLAGPLDGLAGRAISPGLVVGAKRRSGGIGPSDLVSGSAAIDIVLEPRRRSVGNE
jgi:hypothetical protein